MSVVGKVLGKLTGADAARKAAERGADLQAQAGRDAMAQNREMFDLTRADTLAAREEMRDLLAPFIQTGVENSQPFIESSQGLLGRLESLYGDRAGEEVTQSPLFQSLAQDAQRRITASQAARGKLNAGETDVALQDAFLRTGSDLISRERGDALNAVLGLFGAGQNASNAAQDAAAGTGTSAINTSLNLGSQGANFAGAQGDLLAQISNARASGLQGAALAKRQGFRDLLSLGGAIAGAF